MGEILELLDLIIEEVRFRRRNFIWTTVLVTIITCICLFIITFVQGYEYYSNLKRIQKEISTKNKMNDMLNEYKRISDNLNYTIHILPKNVVKDGFYSEGFTHKRIHYSVIKKLLTNFKDDVSELVPLYRQKKYWPENSRNFMKASIALNSKCHTTKETYFGYKQVKPGYVALGYEMHKSKGFKIGDTISINMNTYLISDCINQQGSIDDITIWFNYNDVNRDENVKDIINEIWIWDNKTSLEAYEKLLNKMKKIFSDYNINSKLPSTIFKFKTINASTITAKVNMKKEVSFFKIEKDSISQYFKILLIITSICTFVLSSVATVNNSIKRKKEIALLQSLGFNKSKIYKMFFYRTLILILIGVIFGLLISITFSSLTMYLLWNVLYINPLTIINISLVIIIIGLLMSLFSILLTARFEPASILITE